MARRNLVSGGLLALLMAIGLNLATPRPAEAFIHEIIGALCRFGAEEVIPPGQVREGSASFLRALIASGFITSIDETSTQVTVQPNSEKQAAETRPT